MSYIEIKNLNYWYPEVKEKALEDINLKLENGEILFITGISGSGKSTLAKAITGAVPHFYGGCISGEILINEKNLKEYNHSERASEITMVFQDPEKQLMMNKVHREIAFGLENVAVDETKIKRRVWEAMQFTNILDLAYRDIKTLSGGEKQKVAITSAVAYLPKCIILDEPTSQLDPASAEEIVGLIKKINDELGITIIIIEQRIDKWFDIADKIMIMEEGKSIFSGRKEELYENKESRFQMFLPNYLRVSRKLNIDKMPKNFKEARKKIPEYLKTLKIKPAEVCCDKDQAVNGIIKIKKLTAKYEDKEVLKEINANIKEGDFISILGPNGAGKSTFLKTLMGLVKYKGSIKINENEVSKLKLKDIAKYVGYVSQNPNDYLSKDTLYEELKFTLDNYKITDYQVIDETLKELNILHLKDRNPKDLSGGEKQRAAIASILVLRPKILLLDEPTRGLDIENKRSLGELLKKLNSEGTTIILVTHDVDFSAEFSRRFLLLFSGEITADGNRSEVLSDGIYYTTSVNKLFRNTEALLFSLNQIDEVLGEQI